MNDITPSVAAGILQAAEHKAEEIAARNPEVASLYRDLASWYRQQSAAAMDYGPNMWAIEMAERFMGAPG